MSYRLISKFFLLITATYFCMHPAWSGELLLYNNNASPDPLSAIFEELSSMQWGGVDFVGADIRAFNAAQGKKLGEVLSSNTPEYFTLQVQNAGTGTPEGLAALFQELRSSQFYYVINSQFDEMQGNILGSFHPYIYFFGEIRFDNPASFAQAGNRNVSNGFSIMDDQTAQVLIDNTADFSSLHGLGWPNNGKKITSASVIQLLEKAAENPPQKLLGFDFFGSTGVTDEIAPFLANLLKKCPVPPSFSFDFSYISGENSNSLVAAVIDNLPKQLEAGLNNAFRFNHGNLTGFSKEWWTFFLENSNQLYFAHNNLGNSMQALADAFKNRPSSTSLWLDLSSNNIDDDGATLLFSALGDYLETNHPTDSFYFAFGGNPLGDKGMDALVAFLNRFSSYVDECPWNQVAFDGSNFTSDNWIKLLEALKSTKLSSISLTKSNLSDPLVMKKLGELMVASPKIWYADLKNSFISDEGMVEFAKVLLNISHLPTYVCLQGNAIGTIGAKALADSLKTVKIASNINLYLNRNHIGNEGAKALIGINNERAIAALSLGENPDINVEEILPLFAYQKAGTINLSYMNLTDEQAKILAEIIKANPVFESLIVNNNKIEDSGMLALGEAFIFSLKQIAKNAEATKDIQLSPVKRFDEMRQAYYEYNLNHTQKIKEVAEENLPAFPNIASIKTWCSIQ